MTIPLTQTIPILLTNFLEGCKRIKSIRPQDLRRDIERRPACCQQCHRLVSAQAAHLPRCKPRGMDLGPLLSGDQLFPLRCMRHACTSNGKPDPHLGEGIRVLCDSLRDFGIHIQESNLLGLARPALIFHLLPAASCLPRHHCSSIGLIGNRIARELWLLISTIS